MDQKRWSQDSEVLPSTFCLSRPSTPQSVKKALLSPGSLRSLGKKLSLTGLSERSKKASPDREQTLREHLARSRSPLARSFRPLSIVTGALSPFEFDVGRAMDIVQNQPHSLASASASASSSFSLAKNGGQNESLRTLSLTSDCDDEKAITPGSMSTSFNMSSQQERKQKAVAGDFRALTKMPPPDLSQHPAFQTDPMSSTSDAPLMVTSSTAAQIRQWRQEGRFGPERGTRVNFNTNPSMGNNHNNNPFAVDTNNPFNAQPVHTEGAMTSQRPAEPPARRTIVHPHHVRHGLETPVNYSVRKDLSRLQIDHGNAETDIYDIGAESSQMIATPSQPKTSVDSAKTASTPLSDGFEQKKTGLRKVTDLFKGKPSFEKSESDLASPRGPIHEFLRRPDLERYMRITTNNHSLDYDPGQPFPRHPNTSRAWNSRNLKCSTCMDQCCAVCGRACCAYKAAVLAIKIHKDNPESLRVAEERLLQIAYLFPYGQETPTFLQCTRGDEIGCGKMVCPDCCGECPNPVCRDIQCRKCKQNPWAECLWHDDEMNRRAL